MIRVVYPVNRKLFSFFICNFFLSGCWSGSDNAPEVEQPQPSAPSISVGSSFEVAHTGLLTIKPLISIDDTASISSINWTVVGNEDIELVEGDEGEVSLTAPMVSESKNIKLEIKVSDNLGQETAQQIDVTVLKGMYASSDVVVTLDFSTNSSQLFFGNFNASPELEVIVTRVEDGYNGLEVYSFDKHLGLVHLASINTDSFSFFSQIIDPEDGSAMLLASEDFYTSTTFSVIENIGQNTQITPIDFDRFSSLHLSVYQSSVTGEGIELAIAIPYPGLYGYDDICSLEKVADGYRCIPQKIFDTSALDPLWGIVERFDLIDLDSDGRQEMLVSTYRYIGENGDSPYESYETINEQVEDYKFTFSLELDNDVNYRTFEDFNGDGLLDELVRKENQLLIAEQIEGSTISFSNYINVDGSLCHQDRYIYFGSLSTSNTKSFICRVQETISVRKESDRYVFEKLELPDNIDEVRDVLDINGDQIMDLQAITGEEIFVYLGNGTGFDFDPAFDISNIQTGWESQVDIDADGDLDALKLIYGENQSKLLLRINMLINLN